MTHPSFVFAGTPAFAARHLAALLDAGLRPMAVLTAPDKPAGRGRQLTASPVKDVAEAANLPVWQPTSLKAPDLQASLASLKPDLLVVVAYGFLLPKAVLDIPRLGCWNVHTSLLPRWRGASPIQTAIRAGDTESGVTLMQLNEGMDTGDILIQSACPITSDMTAGDLHDRLVELGCDVLVNALPKAEAVNQKATPQDDALSTIAPKLTKAMAKLQWTLPASELVQHIHAYNPTPVAHCEYDGTIIRLLSATAEASPDPSQAPGTLLACDKSGFLVQAGEGAIRLTQWQLPGKKPQPLATCYKQPPFGLTVGCRFS